VIVLKCRRCKNIWKYKGANPYCTNCSRCKSTVFIKNSSLSSEKRDEFRADDKKVTKNTSADSEEEEE
jgi:hypothetical protein